jgi:hypothetical protein
MGNRGLLADPLPAGELYLLRIRGRRRHRPGCPRAGMHVLLVKRLIRQLLNSHHPSASAAQLLAQRVGLGRGQSQPVAFGLLMVIDVVIANP